MSNNSVVITPVGGTHQVGGNLTLYEFNDLTIAIDCGILLPNNSNYGVKYLVPKLTQLPKLNYLILTHAHEDHIGAVKDLLKVQPNIRIISNEFTAEVLKIKYKISKNITLLDSFTEFILSENLKLFFLPLNHSIPFTNGVILTEELSSTFILHASDFKIEKNSNTLDIDKSLNFLKKLSKTYKTKICLTDSTNLGSSKKKGTSESEVFNSLENIIKSNKSKRLFLTTFSSNLERINSVLELAHKYNRVPIVYSRSMSEFALLGKRMGVIKHNFISDNFENYKNKNDVIIITSGCQGEIKSKLNSISKCEDKFFRFKKNDLVLFSSKVIPGNQIAVSMLINNITLKEGDVILSSDFDIHSSGHAYLKDLEEIYNSVEPNFVIPIHGETFFLKRHERYISKNFPKIKVIRILNGSKISFTLENYEIQEDNLWPLDIIDSRNNVITKEEMAQRKSLSKNGLIHITFNCNNHEIYSKSFGTVELKESELNKVRLFIKNQKILNEKKIAPLLRGYIRKLINYPAYVELSLV